MGHPVHANTAIPFTAGDYKAHICLENLSETNQMNLSGNAIHLHVALAIQYYVMSNIVPRSSLEGPCPELPPLSSSRSSGTQEAKDKNRPLIFKRPAAADKPTRRLSRKWLRLAPGAGESEVGECAADEEAKAEEEADVAGLGEDCVE